MPNLSTMELSIDAASGELANAIGALNRVHAKLSTARGRVADAKASKAEFVKGAKAYLEERRQCLAGGSAERERVAELLERLES